MAASTTRQRRPGRRNAGARTPYVVFISHSSSDSWIAKQMAKEIEARGAKAWLDRHDIAGGDELRKQIMSGLRVCRELVLLLSPHSTESHWVSVEIGAAPGQRKRVTPFCINSATKTLGHSRESDQFILTISRLSC